jgi:glucokinase
VIGADFDRAELPARITTAALDGRCEQCGEALEMFVEAYGAEAGNLALRSVATGGVYIGGGIAPKLRGKLADGTFTQAFRDKGRMAAMLAAYPVRLCLNDRAPLLGAARVAQRLTREP